MITTRIPACSFFSVMILYFGLKSRVLAWWGSQKESMRALTCEAIYAGMHKVVGSKEWKTSEELTVATTGEVIFVCSRILCFRTCVSSLFNQTLLSIFFLFLFYTLSLCSLLFLLWYLHTTKNALLHPIPARPRHGPEPPGACRCPGWPRRKQPWACGSRLPSWECRSQWSRSRCSGLRRSEHGQEAPPCRPR